MRTFVSAADTDSSPERLERYISLLVQTITNSGYTNTFLVGVIQPNPHRVGIG